MYLFAKSANQSPDGVREASCVYKFSCFLLAIVKSVPTLIVLRNSTNIARTNRACHLLQS